MLYFLFISIYYIFLVFVLFITNSRVRITYFPLFDTFAQLFRDNISSHCDIWNQFLSCILEISKCQFFSNKNSCNALSDIAYRNLSDASLNPGSLSRIDGQQKGFLEGRKEGRTFQRTSLVKATQHYNASRLSLMLTGTRLLIGVLYRIFVTIWWTSLGYRGSYT